MKRLVVALAAAAVVGTSGCAAGAPGTAAEVEGESFTVTEMEQATDDANAAMVELGMATPGQELRTADLVALKVQAVTTDRIAEDLGISVPQEELDAQLGQQLPPTVLNDPRIGPVLADTARAQALTGQMNAQDYSTAAAALDVTVNPRFGVWTEQGISAGDPQRPGSTGSLALFTQTGAQEFLQAQQTGQ